jgi:hypothetical protein
MMKIEIEFTVTNARARDHFGSLLDGVYEVQGCCEPHFHSVMVYHPMWSGWPWRSLEERIRRAKAKIEMEIFAAVARHEAAKRAAGAMWFDGKALPPPPPRFPMRSSARRPPR